MAKKLNWDGTDIGTNAAWTEYDNSESGLSSGNVQDAIDEVVELIGDTPSSGGYEPYRGLKLGVIGDSFTAQYDWLSVMNEQLKFGSIVNKAIIGCTWSKNPQDHPTWEALSCARELYSAYTSANTSPDYIIALLGVNDTIAVALSRGEVVGNITYTNLALQSGNDEATIVSNIKTHYGYDDGQDVSFTAGVQSTIAYLQLMFPNARIKIGWTPAGQQYVRLYWSQVSPLVERLKELALMSGVQYIDTFNIGINPWLEDYRSIYEASYGGQNPNLHPSAAGAARIGDYMARILLNNL